MADSNRGTQRDTSHGPPRGGPPTAGTPAPRPASRVLHWSVIIAGLVTIVDLGTIAMGRDGGPESAALLDTLDLVLNAVLYSMAGTLVLRDTGRVALGALAGLLAGAAAGAVVGAAVALRAVGAPAGADPAAIWAGVVGTNVVLGALLAATSATIVRLGSRRPAR